MLEEYYPKLVFKSRLGIIKKDNNIYNNFELIFSDNPYYLKKGNYSKTTILYLTYYLYFIY